MFGSGKTTTAVAEVIKHILTTPKGQTLIGAQTLPQLEQTAMKEFLDVFPQILIKDHNKQKAIITTTNGHRILFRPLYDESVLRGINLSCFLIEEASEVDYSVFVQLQTRLRSHATKQHLGILSSNPDVGKHFLLTINFFNSWELLNSGQS